ncbi:hypothetical protein F5Y19DRAFT_3622 [Xylariaceae sp. FL1651]|nr:hypothetical protein F5Y19DRAFT_3622 [Xylariaceae sp. FL1651]
MQIKYLLNLDIFCLTMRCRSAEVACAILRLLAAGVLAALAASKMAHLNPCSRGHKEVAVAFTAVLTVSHWASERNKFKSLPNAEIFIFCFIFLFFIFLVRRKYGGPREFERLLLKWCNYFVLPCAKSGLIEVWCTREQSRVSKASKAAGS